MSTNRGTTIKKLLLAGILVVMLLPMVQQHIHYFDSEPLKGHQAPAEKVWFSVDGWYAGWYQEAFEKHHAENIGFRPDLVRLHNQIKYSAFNEVSAKQVVVGKENYLYEENYLKAYTGKDYLGKPKISVMVDRIKTLQDSLEKKGITLVICLAAGKASFFPEYIPDSYGTGSDSTNYKVCSAMFRQKNVNHIDFNAWFMSMKGKTEFPLYPKTGIHWSRYGSLMVVDSLIGWVEEKRNVNMPDIIWERTVLNDTLQSPDDDIGGAMNLIWPLKHYAMGYPVWHFEDTVGKAKVKMMTLADSFFWSMFDIGLAPGSFEEINFYYYNSEVHYSNGAPMSVANGMQRVEDVEKSDVVMIMATEATLYGLGWGFIDDAFNHFVLHRAVDGKDKIIQKYEAIIRADVTWMQSIKAKAYEKGISVDSMIFIDAKYMADEEIKNTTK